MKLIQPTLCLAMALAMPVAPLAPAAWGVAPQEAASPSEASVAAPAVGEATDAVDRSVAAAVHYLVSRQNVDGSISPRTVHATALTSMAIMAMAGAGHLPTDPTPEGETMRRALAFVLQPDRQDETGYFGARDNSRMYGHGITTLMLSEMLGMGIDEGQDKLMRARLEPAVALILRSQQERKTSERFRGGWRYTPGSMDADLSVTVWQVMALRSASACGIEVPGSAIDDAVRFILTTYEEVGGVGPADDPLGTFAYQPANSASYSMTSAGVLALQVCGKYDLAQAQRAIRWLSEYELNPNETWFFYGSYYYAQALEQEGGAIGQAARDSMATALLPVQEEDGSFSGSGYEGEPIYATSLALMAMTVRYHYLPIYQR